MPLVKQLQKNSHLRRHVSTTPPCFQQQQTHPLSRRPVIGNSTGPTKLPAGVGRQSWSTATALLLATLTGAAVSLLKSLKLLLRRSADRPMCPSHFCTQQTYILGTQTSSNDSSSLSSTTAASKPKKPKMQDFETAIAELRRSLPDECFSTDREELLAHGASTWTYHDAKALPGVVIYPRHTEDVRRFCRLRYNELRHAWADGVRNVCRSSK